MNNIKFIFLLLTVLMLALFTRIYKLSSYPVSLRMDEVAIGYNAYSILKTGKDEWGIRFPLAFKSVGDYKPPVNIYLTIPFIAVFGLEEIAVRLPTAIMGSLSCMVFALLLYGLGLSRQASVFGGLWLALSPWHLHFSRASFEAITALFFMISGVTSLLWWRKKNHWLLLVLSGLSFSLSVWSYHAERIFVPILTVFLILLNRKSLFSKKNRKSILVTFFVVITFALPFLKLLIFTPAIKTRASNTSILKEASLAKSLHSGNYSNLLEKIFDNDIYLVLRHWAGKYLNYFDIRFIFWKGMEFTPPGYPDLGLLYLIDLPIFLIGIFMVVKTKNALLRKIAIFWMLLGPFPASLTMNEQHPLRAIIWIPFFGIIISAGLDGLGSLIKNRKKMAAALVYFFLFAINFYYFLDIYLYQFPYFHSEYWQYGFKQMAEYGCEHINEYNQIAITDTFGSLGPLMTGTPHYYVLFYCQYDPEHFINSKGAIEKFLIKRPDWRSDSKTPKMLIMGAPWDFPLNKIKEEQIVKKIYYFNGIPGFIAVKTI